MNLRSSEKFYEQTCRTCLLKSLQNSEDHIDLQSIYEFPPEYPTMQIAEILTNTIPQLFIQKKDDFPKKMCTVCIKKLMKVQQFQQMCIESDGKIRAVLEYGAEESKFSQDHEEPATPALFELSAENRLDPLQEATTFLKQEINDKGYDISEDDSNIGDQLEIIGIDRTSDVAVHTKKKEASLSVSCSSHSDDNDEDEDWAQNKDIVGRKIKKRKTQSMWQKGIKLCIETENDEHVGTSNSKDTIVRNSKDFTCAECGKVFKNSYNLKRHMNVHSALEKRFVCPHCKYRFATAKLLQGHVTNLHNNTNKEERDSVGNHKANEDSLTERGQPVDVVTELGKDLECDVCLKTFETSKLATRHKRSHKNIKQKSYVCEYCNKAYKRSQPLQHHIRTHTGEQPYLCPECGKGFHIAGSLQQHLLRHTGIKRFECSDCPKKFTCANGLASHKAVHKKTKPHVCDICGSAFVRGYELTKHKVYHNGDKPHKCEYCEMRFVRADHVRRHMRTHTGEQPYKCKYCQRAFSQSNEMIKHLRSHLGENVYKCELCPRGFRMACEMRAHFAEHKYDDEETRQRNLQALMEDEANLRTNMLQPQLQINDDICN